MGDTSKKKEISKDTTQGTSGHVNVWCPQQEQLLIRWSEMAAGYRWLHNDARVFYLRQNNWLTYPCIIISSITGVGGFAVLNPSSDSGTSDSVQQKIIIVQYFFAFLNVVAGILNSVAKFNDSSKRLEAHSSMCVQYSKYYRNIEMELSLEKKDRGDVLKFVSKQRSEYERLLEEAPDIPSASIDKFNYLFPDKENKPDVCNGLNFIPRTNGCNSDTDSTKARASVMRWLTRKSISRSPSSMLHTFKGNRSPSSSPENRHSVDEHTNSKDAHQDLESQKLFVDKVKEKILLRL